MTVNLVEIEICEAFMKHTDLNPPSNSKEFSAYYYILSNQIKVYTFVSFQHPMNAATNAIRALNPSAIMRSMLFTVTLMNLEKAAHGPQLLSFSTSSRGLGADDRWSHPEDEDVRKIAVIESFP